MGRPQFSLKTLLWLMICFACFGAGVVWQRRQYEIQVRDWIYLVNGQETNHVRLIDENKRLHRQVRDLQQEAP